MGRTPSIVAVTGITGTVGGGLLPFLHEDPAVERVIGVGGRDWEPTGPHAAKVEYRRADIRDQRAVHEALDEAEAVVHLAFSFYRARRRGGDLDEVDLEGSRNVLRGAIDNGAARFIYTSSAAVYGFDDERPGRVGERADVAPAERHFYSRQKARLERELVGELRRKPEIDWIVFRPCAIVGPHAIGAGAHGPPRAARSAASVLAAIGAGAGLRPPLAPPPVPLQFVHERDVGQAIHRALSSEDANRIYNLGGDGLVEPADVPRLLGLRTLPVPPTLTKAALRGISRLPYLSPALGWSELLTRPLELDTTRAKRELDWSPEFDSRDALAATRRALAI